MNTRDFADIKHMTVADYARSEGTHAGLMRTIGALKSDCWADGRKDLADICIMAEGGDDVAFGLAVDVIDGEDSEDAVAAWREHVLAAAEAHTGIAVPRL